MTAFERNLAGCQGRLQGLCTLVCCALRSVEFARVRGLQPLQVVTRLLCRGVGRGDSTFRVAPRQLDLLAGGGAGLVDAAPSGLADLLDQVAHSFLGLPNLLQRSLFRCLYPRLAIAPSEPLPHRAGADARPARLLVLYWHVGSCPKWRLRRDVAELLRALTLREHSTHAATARSYGRVALDAIDAHAGELQRHWRASGSTEGRCGRQSVRSQPSHHSAAAIKPRRPELPWPGSASRTPDSWTGSPGKGGRQPE